MALHKNFPKDKFAILDPKIRWFPAEEVLIFKGILEIIIKTSTRLEKTLEHRIKLPNGEIK